MTTLPADYLANYDRIAGDHLASVDAYGTNPFMPPDLVNDLEHATRELIRKYAEPGDSILDAGCGPGTLLASLPEYKRFGCDISAAYLDRARAAGYIVRCEPVEALSYRDGRFNLVVCADVLEHVLDLNQAVRELLRVLKPGGLLIVRVPDQEDIAGYLDCGYTYVHLRRFDEATLRLLFTKVFGVDVVETPRVRDEIHAVVSK